MQSSWFEALDIADSYWELESLQDFCINFIKLSRGVAEDIGPTFEGLAPYSGNVLVLSTADSESLVDYQKLPSNTVSGSGGKALSKSLKWTAEDDRKLTKLAKAFSLDWTRIAGYFPERTAQALAKRWNERPWTGDSISFGWSKIEDQIILQLYETEGADWIKIAAYLPGRFPCSVKNRFFGTLKKSMIYQVSSDLERQREEEPSKSLENPDNNQKRPELTNAVDSNAADNSNTMQSSSIQSLSLEGRTSTTRKQRRQRLELLKTREQSLELSLEYTKAQIAKLETKEL